jgi:hypothetical protein
MADSKTYDSKPKSPGTYPADGVPQHKVLAQSGKPKTAAQAGDTGKCSTPKPW